MTLSSQNHSQIWSNKSIDLENLELRRRIVLIDALESITTAKWNQAWYITRMQDRVDAKQVVQFYSLYSHKLDAESTKSSDVEVMKRGLCPALDECRLIDHVDDEDDK